MIARELLVKLGFDIDEQKINRFTRNIDAIKTKMANVKNNLAFNIDGKKLDNFDNNLESIKAKMANLKNQINKKMYPEVDAKSLAAYRRELERLPKHQKTQILALNKAEKIAINDQIKADRARYKQLQAINAKLTETQRNFKSAARIARSANMTFSRYFTRFTLIGSGSFLLSLRKTLKDAQDFKDGGASKTNNIFSSKQIYSVDRFNISLKQTKKALGELRNKFIIDLLPSFKEYLDDLNKWLLKNKELINSKVKKFVDILGDTLKRLSSIISALFSALNPLVDLIGGWGMVLSGIIGLGILSWLLRLGIFLKAAGTAILVFVGAIRTLTIVLMTNPLYLALTAIAAALMLITDEFIVTSKGGDSLMNRFTGLKTAVYSFVDSLKEAWQWLVKVKNNMIDFTLGGIDKVKNFFSNDKTSSKELQKQRTEIINGLKVTYVDRGKFGINDRAKNTYHNNSADNKKITLNQKHNFNVNINVSKGTTSEQSIDIAKEVQKQVQAEIKYSNEKALNAIGAY